MSRNIALVVWSAPGPPSAVIAAASSARLMTWHERRTKWRPLREAAGRSASQAARASDKVSGVSEGLPFVPSKAYRSTGGGSARRRSVLARVERL